MKNRAKQIRRTETEIRRLLNLYSKEQRTVTEFCKGHQIHKANFYNWRNKYGTQPEKKAEFIPIEFNQPPTSSELFAEIELISKGTVRLYRRVDASYVKTLLKK